MKVLVEISLKDFEFWSGAKDTANELSVEELSIIESQLEMEYPDGIDEEYLNDLFRYEEDYIAQMLGYDEWEEFMHRIDTEDEEEF